MIWVGDNVQAGVLNGGLDGATVHSDSGRIWQDEFVACNKNPNLAIWNLNWILKLQYQKYWLRSQFEKSVVVLE